MEVFERVRSSTRLTITAQASAGPPELPGKAPAIPMQPPKEMLEALKKLGIKVPGM